MKRTFLRIGIAALALGLIGVTTLKTFAAGDELSNLRDTMLNAVDHYKAVQASYIHRSYSETGAESTLKVDVKRQPGGGASAKMTRPDGVVVNMTTDGKQRVEHDTSTDEYLVANQLQPRTGVNWATLARHLTKEDGRKSVVLRPETTELPLGWPGTALFPQEWVLGTYDVSTVRSLGDEPMLGLTTKKLSVEAPNGRTFVLNVDPKSGIIVKMVISKDGKTTDVLEATSLQINGAINASEFALPDLHNKKVRQGGA